LIGKIDYWVNYCEDEKELAHRQIEYAFLERNRSGKNTFVAHTGKSREGKSSMTLSEIEFMLKMHDIYLEDNLELINKMFVYTPFEYPDKLDALLNDKELKKVHFITIDDARFVINAKRWQTFLNQAIADVSSIAGRIKPLTVFINTQFLKDIDYDFRLALDFWGSAYRSLHGKAEMRYFRFWLDERDPEKLRMRKRTMRGIVVKDNKRIMYEPEKYVFNMPTKKVWDFYDQQSYEAKGKLVRKKLDDLMKEMRKESGLDNRLEQMIEYYSKPQNYDGLMMLFEYKYRKAKLKKDAHDILGLSKQEGQEFANRIAERLRHIQKESEKKYNTEARQDELLQGESSKIQE